MTASRVAIAIALALLIAPAAGRAATPGGTAGAGVARTQAEAGISRKGFTEASRRTAVRYWTPRRAVEAIRNGNPTGPTATGFDSGLEGPSGWAGPRTVRPAHDPTAGHRSDAGASHGPADPEVAGNSANGRLFLRFRGRKASCSATLVNTRRLNLAITAGHCLFGLEFGGWAGHVAFVPAYDHGKRPFGTYPAKRLLANTAGLLGDPNLDLGAVILGRNSRGRPGHVAGASGWATGISRWRRFSIFGYPAGAFKAAELRRCVSRSYRANRWSYRLPGPPAVGANCDMARGSSGGGWFTSNGAEADYLNGLTSYSVRPARNRIYSPYFGRAALRLIRQAR